MPARQDILLPEVREGGGDPRVPADPAPADLVGEAVRVATRPQAHVTGRQLVERLLDPCAEHARVVRADVVRHEAAARTTEASVAVHLAGHGPAWRVRTADSRPRHAPDTYAMIGHASSAAKGSPAPPADR